MGLPGLDPSKKYWNEDYRLTPEELQKLTQYLRMKFELPSIQVKKRPQKDDSAEVYIG
ncbi:MAG TPA: DUF3126 family protein, partial [Aestuariivirgaceae bacterium]|nr:DUF3126 family protein [Aestuariivirgaceae bacterium]